MTGSFNAFTFLFDVLDEEGLTDKKLVEDKEGSDPMDRIDDHAATAIPKMVTKRRNQVQGDEVVVVAPLWRPLLRALTTGLA